MVLKEQEQKVKVYNMVRSMKQGGIPIDGVGLQMHVSTGYYPNANDLGNNIKRLVALGLEVHITEMDVSCSGSSEFNTQAQIYGTVLTTCLSIPGCKSYQSWGMTDKYSWLGTAKHPLPFDENYNWKPAANTILSVLNAYGGVNVQAWTCNGKPEQQWSIGATGELTTQSDNWCLDIQLSGSMNQTNAWTYPCGSQHTNILNQKWKVPSPSSKGQIISTNTNKCLELVGSGRGENVRIATCNGLAKQLWMVHEDGHITSQYSGLCLDAGSWKD